MAKAITTQQGRPIDAFKQQITLAMPTLKHMIPAHVTPEKFSAMIVTAVAYSKDLLECSTESLIRETAQAAELGLSLNKSLREADILTVWNGAKQCKEAQMRPRYMGLMKLARQSGEIVDIYAHVVHEGDEFDQQLGLDKKLIHRPTGGGDVTHAYVVWTTKDGIKAFEVLDRKRLDNIRDRSEGYRAFKANKIKSTPWESDYEEMCRKTAVRAGSKYMPISNEKWATALRTDDRGDAADVAEFDAGYVDVTATGADTPATPPTADAGEAQAQKLADRVAVGGPGSAYNSTVTSHTTAARISVIDVPEGFDGPDYGLWEQEAVAALKKLGKPERGAWMEAHAGVLAKAPKQVADAVRGLV